MSISRLPSGRWRAQVHVPGQGNVSVSKVLGGSGTFRTKAEAKAAREQARARLGAARHDVTVTQFRDRWLSDPLFARPRESTNVTNADRTKDSPSGTATSRSARSTIRLLLIGWRVAVAQEAWRRSEQCGTTR